MVVEHRNKVKNLNSIVTFLSFIQEFFYRQEDASKLKWDELETNGARYQKNKTKTP